MISYRPYRNTDPPALTEVWNESATGRGTFPVRTPALLERWVFSKPYFDPAGLIVAEESDENGKRIIGFALAGFGPTEDQAAIDLGDGVTCAVLVRPDHRRRGVGRELVRRCEEYLTGRGADRLSFGSQWPRNPFLLGLYGGSNSPGVLESSPEAAGFLTAVGYKPAETVVVYQRRLDQPLTVADPRFAMLRKRYDVQLLKAAVVGSYWQECQWATLEPAEFRAVDKLTGLPAARAVAFELEGFSWRWGFPSAGICDVQVRPDLRKQGVAKMLVAHILRFLQDQFFGIGELQVRADDAAGVGLCKAVGFDAIDLGHVYRKAGG